jgi:hypothetical protein
MTSSGLGLPGFFAKRMRFAVTHTYRLKIQRTNVITIERMTCLTVRASDRFLLRLFQRARSRRISAVISPGLR